MTTKGGHTHLKNGRQVVCYEKCASETVGAAKRKLCEQCGARAVAYEGARFCGAACTARHEAHEPPEVPS